MHTRMSKYTHTHTHTHTHTIVLINEQHGNEHSHHHNHVQTEEASERACVTVQDCPWRQSGARLCRARHLPFSVHRNINALPLGFHLTLSGRQTHIKGPSYRQINCPRT